MPDQSKQYFLTILLSDKHIQSSLVSNNGQGLQIKEFSEIRSYFDRQDLLDQVDKSLQELGPDSQDIVETVFAFDQTWLEENGELSDEKKPIVKELTESLSLEALGQFSIPEALAEARLIGDEADSCLLLLLKDKSLDLLFLKHGQFLDLISVGRSEQIVDDFSEILARANKHLKQAGTYFPSKVLLTSLALKNKELEDLQKQLAAVDWTKNPGFAQAPTIVVLEQDYMIKSVSLSAGKILTKEHFKAKMHKGDFSSTEAFAEDETMPEPSAPTPTPAAAQVGDDEYAVERSATNPREGAVERSVSPSESAMEKASATSFGITFDPDSLAKKPATASNSREMQAFMDDDDMKPQRNKHRSAWARFYFSHQKMILIGAAVGLLSLLVLGTVFAFFFSKVTVFITPEESLLQKSVAITLDPTLATSDFDKALLKASLENKTVSGQDVLVTTGIGLVGDKAKGKVAIYNKTDEAVDLSAGDVLSTDGIEFLLDSDVNIPAQVVKENGSSKTIDYGTVETTVTAKDIGAEANLNKETKLRVTDYFDDKFSASTMENFSGGSSREVRVVSEVDRTNLLESLRGKLIEDARAQLEAESVEGTYLVPTGQSKTITTDFSAEVGAETDSLTLSLTLEVEAVKYASSELKTLALGILQKDLPEGYVLLDEDPSLLSDRAQVASGSSRITLNADLSAKAIANLDLAALKTTVLDKPWLTVEEDLEKHDQIKSARVLFHPPFLTSILRKLPNDPDRIILQLEQVL